MNRTSSAGLIRVYGDLKEVDVDCKNAHQHPHTTSYHLERNTLTQPDAAPVEVVHLPPRPHRSPITEWLRYIGLKEAEAALSQERITQEAALAVAGEGNATNSDAP